MNVNQFTYTHDQALYLLSPAPGAHRATRVRGDHRAFAESMTHGSAIAQPVSMSQSLNTISGGGLWLENTHLRLWCH